MLDRILPQRIDNTLLAVMVVGLALSLWRRAD